MCPRALKKVESSAPRVQRRRYWPMLLGLAVGLMACYLLGVGILPALAIQNQWPQYQRYPTHPGAMPANTDPASTPPAITAPTTLGGGSNVKWVIDTRHNGRWGSVKSTASVTVNAGTAVLDADFTAGQTFTLTIDTSNRVSLGDLLTVGEYPPTQAWQNSHTYSTGDCIRPTTGSKGFYYECTTAGTSAATEPDWTLAPATTPGGTTTDGGVTWTTRVGSESLGAITVIAPNAVNPAKNDVTVTNPATVPHVAGTKVYITPAAALQTALTASDVSPDQLTLTAATINKVHVGDILAVGNYPPTQVWKASTAYTAGQLARPTVLNNFYYKVTTAGTSDVTEPTWPTTVGSTVKDGTVIWTCCTGSEYLGPVLAIDRALHIVKVTYPYTVDHAVTEPVRISPYREDNLTAGGAYGYAGQTLTANIARPTDTPTRMESQPWYDNSKLYNPATTTFLLMTRVTPYFTDDAGQPLLNFRTDTGGGQEIRVGFREDDSAVKNPIAGNLDSPIYVYAYLTDTGKLSIRRQALTAAGTDPNSPAVAAVPNAGTYTLANGIDLALAITNLGPNQATATLYYRVADTSGAFASGFTGFTPVGSYALPASTLPAVPDAPNPDYVDNNLPSAVYPYLQAFNFGNFSKPQAKPFAFSTNSMTVYLSNPIAGGALGPGARSMQVIHPERFLYGDLIDIIDPSDPAIHDTARITGIGGNTISFVSNRSDGNLGNIYPSNTMVRAGQPGKPTAYVGDENGVLHASNPEVMESYNGAKTNEPEQHWLQPALNYLGAVSGAPAVDANLGRVYVTSLSGRLFAFLQNGQLAWIYPTIDQPALGPIHTAPVVDDQGNIYIAADSGSISTAGLYPGSQVYKINPDGVLAADATPFTPSGLTAQDTAQITSLALYRTDVTNTGTLRVVVGVKVTTQGSTARTGMLYSLDHTLTEKWRYATGPLSASPVIGTYTDANGLLHATIYIGDENGNLYALYEAGTGAIMSRWVKDAINDTTAITLATQGNSPVTTAGAISDDGMTVYFGDSAGNLYAITATGFDTDGNGVTNYDQISQAKLDTKFADTRLLATDTHEPVTSPLTLDAGGNLLVGTSLGSVFDFDTTQFTKPAGTFVAPRWKWNTKGNTGMQQSLPIHSAPALWSVGGSPIVIVGGDDGIVYAINNGGGQHPNNTAVATADGLWPFFHKDEYHAGDMGQMHLTAVGPNQPSLRWFAPGKSKLTSSSVVTDHTPNGAPWVLQGTEEGRLFAYDASSGKLINQLSWAKGTTKDSDGYVPLTGMGPVRGTPAVHAGGASPQDGMIAVPTMGGSLHIVTADGQEMKHTRGANPQHLLLGNFQASPVISKDGTIYATTVDELDTSGTYAGPGATTTLCDGDDTTGTNALKSGDTLTYTRTTPAYITCVRLCTQNDGTINIYNGTQVLLTQTYAASTKPRYIHLDTGLAATKVEWVNGSGTGKVTEFEVFSAGTVSVLPLATLVPSVEPATAHIHYYADNAQTDVLSGTELRADIHIPGTPPETLDDKLFVNYIVLQFDATHPAATYSGTLSVMGADGRTHAIMTFAPQPSQTYVIPINRTVTRIIWKGVQKDVNNKDVDGPSVLKGITVYQRDFSKGQTGGSVYAFKPDFTVADAKLNFLWKYPSDGNGYLAPMVGSPVIVSGANPDDHTLDTIYVATTGGQVIAVKGDGTLPAAWPKPVEVYNPISAAPVLVNDSTGALTYLLVADEGGDVHLLDGGTGNAHLGWPVVHLDETFATSPAVTSDHKAYQVSAKGNLYKIDMSREQMISPDPAPAATPITTDAASFWTPASPVYSVYSSGLALIGRLAPTFTANDQTVSFGLHRADGTDYATITISNPVGGPKVGLTIAGSTTTIPLVTLPGGTDLSQGIELALTVIPVGNTARVSGYYRLPVAGAFTGSFLDLGGDTANGQVQLKPFALANSPSATTFNTTLTNVTFFPVLQFLVGLGTAVSSSPVIDSTGHLFLGGENGLVYCLEPESGTPIRWSYVPWRSTIYTTLAENAAGGTQRLKVLSVLGFKLGDPVEITQADGTNPEDLGLITAITPPAGSVATSITAEVPGANVRELPLATVDGVNVGDDVNALAPASAPPNPDPSVNTEYAPQFVRYLGKVVKVDANGKKITLDRDIKQIDLHGDGTADDNYPFNTDLTYCTKIYIGSTEGYLEVSNAPGSYRYVGDIIRVKRRLSLPIRTSPSIGPVQTLYIGCDDGILYAIGPVGPSGAPGPLPLLYDQGNDDTWPAWRHDDGRTGFANRQGVRQPGYLYDAGTNTYSIGTRWMTDTASQLYSSPALGYTDAGSPVGVLYIGTASQRDLLGNVGVGGSLLAMDGNLGGILWQFDDNHHMGQVYSSPSVIDIYRSDDLDLSSREELVVFGTEDAVTALSAQLVGAIVLDANGKEVALSPVDPSLADGINSPNRTGLPTPQPPDRVVALLMVNGNIFSDGMQIALSDTGSGTNYEVFGNVSGTPTAYPGHAGWYLVRLKTSHQSIAMHMFANTTAHSQDTQQGHLYAVTRDGVLKWKFPADGSDTISMIHASPAVTSHVVKPADYDTTLIYGVTRTGVVYALDLDGHEQWSHYLNLIDPDTGKPVTGQIDVVSSPVLDTTGARLFIGVNIVGSPNSYLVALDLTANDDDTRQLTIVKNGNQVPWIAKLDGEIDGTPVFASDETAGDRLYVGTDIHSDAGDTGKIYAISLTDALPMKLVDGTTVQPLADWPVDAGKIPADTNRTPLGPITGSLAMVPATSQTRFSNPKVATGNQHKILLFDKSGKPSTAGLQVGMRVKLRWASGVQEWRIKQIDTDGVVLYAPPTTPDPVIPQHDYLSLATNEQMLIAGSRDGNIYVLSEQLVPIGRFPTAGPIIASPAISVEKDIAAPGVRSYTAYLGSYDRYLHALTIQPVMPDNSIPATISPITERWKAYLYEAIDSSPAVGIAAVDTNGQALLYQAGGDQRMYCFPGNQMIIPPPPHHIYHTRPTLQVTKTVEKVDPADPNIPAGEKQYTWWKLTVTLRNNGAFNADNPDIGTITNVKLFDNLPASICAGPLGGDINPPAPFVVNLKPDEWAVTPVNHGTLESPQWELHWSDKEAGAEGAGFTLKTRSMSPAQVQTDYQRVFTFYAAIRESTRTYENLGTKFRVTGNPSVMASSTAVNDPAIAVVSRIGDTVYLQMTNHPIPLENGSSDGKNQAYAVGTTKEGYDNNLQDVSLESHTETPVKNDWVTSDRSFIVRLYYNGKKSDFGKLAYNGLGDTRDFSPWNVRDPETGDPALFKNTFNPKPTGRVEARGVQMVMFKFPPLGIANSGIRFMLTPQSRRFDRVLAPAATVDSGITPYGWRLSIMQGKAQLGDRIDWGEELFYEDRVLLTQMKNGATISNNPNGVSLDVIDPTRIKLHHILLIGENTEVFVKSVNPVSVIGLQQTATVNANDEVRDEWSPDLVITSPVSVASGVNADHLSLGDVLTPGNTTASGPINVKNDSINWGAPPTNPYNRFMVAPLDLRLNNPKGITDWNNTLNLANMYNYGVPSAAWSDWVDARYDPYLESHIRINPDALDLPAGSGLYHDQSMSIRFTQSIPNGQPASNPGDAANQTATDGNSYTTAPESWRVVTDANTKVVFVDINGTGAYDQNTTPRLNDINGNSLWDPDEFFYFDLNGDGVYQQGEPVYARDKYGLRIFLDLNGNGVYDPGEPIYEYNAGTQSFPPMKPAIAPNPAEPVDFAAHGADAAGGLSDLPLPLVARLGIGGQAHLEATGPGIDFGKQSLFTSGAQPVTAPALGNSGNLMLYVQTVGSSSTMAYTDGTGGLNEYVLPYMMNAGINPTYYDPATKSIRVRNPAESYPYEFTQVDYTADPNRWMVPKIPVGTARALSRPFDMVTGGAKFSQPSGIYYGDTTIFATDNDPNVPHSDWVATLSGMRVTESDLAQTVSPPLPQSPPSIDYSRVLSADALHQADMKDWTVVLTGSESWPTATVLAKKSALNPNEPDMPAVVVASNTPLLDNLGHAVAPADMMPAERTDTTLWYRRVKHLVTAPTQQLPSAAGTTTYQLYIPQNYWNVVRVTDNGVSTDNVTSDFVVLRKRPGIGDGQSLPDIFARVTGKGSAGNQYYLNIDTVTAPAAGLVWNPTDTVVEIYSHPWIPLLGDTDMSLMRAAMDDPGNPSFNPANPASGIHPLRCSQPSFITDAAGDPWLVWTVSGTRTITVSGQANHKPVSYICYKKFNPDKPTDNPVQWIGMPDTPTEVGGPIVYPDREHPQLLADVNGLGGLALYDTGVEGNRKLMVAVNMGQLNTPTWVMDIPLDALNWSFNSASLPQAWADPNGAGGPQSPMQRVNMIFQAHRPDGNIDLYYARLKVGTGAEAVISLLPLRLPEGDAAGLVTENFTTSGTGVFTGGQFLAWAPGLQVVVNGTPLPLTIDDSKREYELSDAGKTFRLSVDPYRGIVRVVEGTVTSIAFIGQPRVQRLTNNLAPDVNPIVSVERYRYLTADGNGNPVPYYGPDGTLQAQPRIWLFWTRHHEDGLGTRAYYRTLRMSPAGGAEYSRLDAEVRGNDLAETAANTWNIDMPDRMLPMDAMAPDGSLFVTRQSASVNSGQAGLWVFSTASRSIWPKYPDPSVHVNQFTLHDLYMQSINVPAPDTYKK